jgi:hypothetical protein
MGTAKSGNLSYVVHPVIDKCTRPCIAELWAANATTEAAAPKTARKGGAFVCIKFVNANGLVDKARIDLRGECVLE